MSTLLKKYVRKELSERTSLGTLKSIAGKGGKIDLNPRNFVDLSKQVFVIVSNKKGESAAFPCSKAVSKGLRNKSISLPQLALLELMEGDITLADGTTVSSQIVSMPSNTESTNFGISVDAINEANVEPVSNKALTEEEINELVAF